MLDRLRVCELRRPAAQWAGNPGNVGSVVQTELRIGFIEPSGVERVVVWCIYETKGDKIAVANLVGQRTDSQTARFIRWIQSQPPAK